MVKTTDSSTATLFGKLSSPTSVQNWLIAMLSSAIFFGAAPWADIFITNLFFEDRFIWVGSDLVELTRQTLLVISALPAVLALLALALSMFGIRLFNIQTSLWAFALLVYVSGPGILVNGILKQFWGRARPDQIVEFGGSLVFTPALQISDQCSGNCSFVSAETASAAAFAISVLVLSKALNHSSWQKFLRAFALLPVLVIGLSRIALGRHFFSDVVFAVLVTIGCAIGLAMLFREFSQFDQKNTNQPLQGQ